MMELLLFVLLVDKSVILDVHQRDCGVRDREEKQLGLKHADVINL